MNPPKRASPVVALVTEDGTRHAVSQQRHPSRSYGKVFHTVFDEAAEQLAIDLNSAAGFKVALILPKYLSYTVFRSLDQRELGAKLKLDDSSISRSLAKLTELGMVERKGKGPVTKWRLTLDFGWRGSVDAYHEAKRTRGQPGKKPPSGGASIGAEDLHAQENSATPGRQNRAQTSLRLMSLAKPPARSVT